MITPELAILIVGVLAGVAIPTAAFLVDRWLQARSLIVTEGRRIQELHEAEIAAWRRQAEFYRNLYDECVTRERTAEAH